MYYVGSVEFIKWTKHSEREHQQIKQHNNVNHFSAKFTCCLFIANTLPNISLSYVEYEPDKEFELAEAKQQMKMRQNRLKMVYYNLVQQE